MIRLYFVLALLCSIGFAKDTIVFGVFVQRSDHSTQEYEKVVDYLNRHLDGVTVKLLPLGREEMNKALERNQIDFLTTNPSHYEIIQHRNLLTRVIATTQHIVNGIKTDSLGGVIFTSSNNQTIKSLKDIKNHSIAVMDQYSLGGYQAQAYECLQHGIDIKHEAKLIKYHHHDEVIKAVLSEEADVGFVRTGTIESMLARQEIEAHRIKILNPRNLQQYPYVLSTRLYPEWPIVTMPHIDEELVRKLSILLLDYKSDELQFTFPQDYDLITTLMKSLRLPPYDKRPKITWVDVYHQYQYYIISFFVFAFILIITLIQIARLNLRIRSNEERFTLAIEGTRDGLFDWNMLTNEMFHSKNFETLLGYNGNELPQTLKAWEDNVHPDDLASTYKIIDQYIRSKESEVYSATFRMRAKDGSWKWIEGRGKVLLDKKGNPVRFIGFNSDITEKKEHELKLEYAAGHDLLTNLPNRTLLSNLMPKYLSSTKRHNNHLALLFIDLDGFKEINDVHGHDIGDQLLKEVAIRMQSLLRKEDIVARLGGDEFALLISNLNERNEITHLVSRLLKLIADPYLIHNQTMNVSASIGISFYPQNHEVDADMLLRQADQAMYDAKFNGKNQYHCFDDIKDHTKKVGNDQLAEIIYAIHNDELVLHYQPKVNMTTGAIVGAEALVRWNSPQKGMQYPDSFLPFIENRPGMYELDMWVINRVLKDLTQLKAAGFEEGIRFSINLSAYAFKQQDLLIRIQKLLADYPDISPTEIEFEILETSALHNINDVQNVIAQLHDIGITVALDDFGTGYASMNYLKKLNVDYLKIDRSFIMDILHDSGDLRILEATIGLADAFRSSVVAEGVESEAHGELLIQFGCYYAQGYTIAKPMPPESLVEWSKTWTPYDSWKNKSQISQKLFPILYAATEHRNWYNELKSYIQGTSETIPQLNTNLCQFGQWLNTEGKTLIEDQQAYDDIFNLHEQFHEASKSLIDQNHEKYIDVDAMDQFYALHCDLLTSLDSIIKESHSDNNASF